MFGMRRRHINQVHLRVIRKFLVAAIRASKSVIVGKLLRLFQGTRRNGIRLYPHPLLFKSLDRSGHLCRDMPTTENCKLHKNLN